MMDMRTKDIANYLSISRIIMSIIMCFTKSFSFTFYFIYVYCGLSDTLDGYIARKNKTTSEVGEKIDSIADVDLIILEVAICIIATFSAVQEGHYIRIKKVIN